MDIQSLIAQLTDERAKIDDALAALSELAGVQFKVSGKGTKRRRRFMSADARARISASMRKRWALRKGKVKPPKNGAKDAKPAKPGKKGRGGMSPAARAKLSRAMKKRWRNHKAAGGQGKPGTAQPPK